MCAGVAPFGNRGIKIVNSKSCIIIIIINRVVSKEDTWKSDRKTCPIHRVDLFYKFDRDDMGVCVSVDGQVCVMYILICTCVFVYLNAKKREGASAKVYRYLNASRRLSIVVELIVFLN